MSGLRGLFQLVGAGLSEQSFVSLEIFIFVIPCAMRREVTLCRHGICCGRVLTCR